MMLIHKSIRIINYETQQVTPRETPESFDAYVAELINHISNNASVREYKTRSNQTEVIGCILSICANQDDEAVVSSKMDIMANRLLLKEIEAQGKIRRTNTTVQKGSLIQALLFNEPEERYEYLLAKVEHTEWVDDSDFTFKTGFSKDKKTMWKSCLFDLSNFATAEFHAMIYSDTKAQYWSNGFLELDEFNSDGLNTQRAFKAIDAALGYGFKGVTSPDKTIIRNSFIAYLKNNEHIDFPIMVNSVLENYRPVDTDLTEEEVIAISNRIQNIRTALLAQPEKKHFDNQFNAVNSAINARIRKVYPINDGIVLKVTADINDLSGTIRSVEEDGVKYIKVRTNNDKTYNSFHF